VEASARRIALTTMCEFRIEPVRATPTVLLGYAQRPEPTIRSGSASWRGRCTLSAGRPPTHRR
jgi:hypothetical protein